MSLRTLVVDDEKAFADLLSSILRREGYEVDAARSGVEALARLGETTYDLVLCDIQMPEMDGLEFLRQALARGVMRTTIMMSAYGGLDTAIEAMKLGAYDYISKPFQRDAIVLTLRKAEERERLRRENRELRAQRDRENTFDRMVARSDVMQRLFRTIEKVSVYKTTVLLTGESGTGKELAARSIHRRSPRGGEFVAVNCGAIPESLLESELFGHVRGAFTDARSDKRGLFEEASGGTLFLDEVSELPQPLQVKLLRALQEGEIRRVGDTKSIAVDSRVIAASGKDLAAEVKRGAFREDLFYRLNVLPIRLPPLRERSEDIPLLVDHFVALTNQRLGTTARAVSPEALEAMLRYSWPGNVRELENTIERAIVLSDSDVIVLDALPEVIIAETDRIHRTLRSGDLSVRRTTRIIEEELIRRALKKTGGNRTAASRLLELSHRALLYKIKEYGISDS
jgi:two-component system response regulator AtoC